MAHAHGTRHTPLHKDPADPSRGSPLPPFCVNGVAVRRCALPTSVGFLSLFRFRFLRCRFGLPTRPVQLCFHSRLVGPPRETEPRTEKR